MSLGIFLDQSLPYCLRQDLSLNIQLNVWIMSFRYPVSETSAGIIDMYQCAVFVFVFF